MIRPWNLQEVSVVRQACPGSRSSWASTYRLRPQMPPCSPWRRRSAPKPRRTWRSEEHTSELQSRLHLVCRLLLEKKKKKNLHRCHASVDKSVIGPRDEH